MEPSVGASALRAGMRKYEEGSYVDAARYLQGAIDLGLNDAEAERAHKYLAFMHCASRRERACREEFRKALAVNPKFALSPAEAGHPAWGPVFASVKAAAPTPFKLALQQYEAGEYDESAKNFEGALREGLDDKDRANAHKHLAFIHCAAQRERQCREEFRKALAADPSLELAPAEAGHPAWGPVFASLRSAVPPFTVAVRQYEAGEYPEAAKNFEVALREGGLGEKEAASAHKHLAFIHCASRRERQCREEFRKALAVDPALELEAAEAGHPVWGPVFRSVKAGR